MIKAAIRAVLVAVLFPLMLCSSAWAQDLGDMSQQDVLSKQLSDRIKLQSGTPISRPKLPVTDARDQDLLKESRLTSRAKSPLPPEEPTDFQRQIEQSIGTRLPIFGQSLFTDVPDTFAPLDRVPVTADYVIGPGDEILVRVWGQVDMDLKLVVDRNGTVSLPEVGNVSVAGVSYKDLGQHLKKSLSRTFRNFEINASLGQLRSIQVLVVG